MISLLTALEYLLGYGFGIDLLLAADATPVHPGRMAPATAGALFLIGLALLLLSCCTPAAQIVACAALTVGMLGSLAYLFGAETVQSVEMFATMSPVTALLIALLAVGVLIVRPSAGIMCEISAPLPGGRAARHLLLWSPPLLVVLGGLRLYGQASGLYGTGFGLALMLVLILSMLLVAAWITTRSINRAHRAVRQSEQRFRGILDSAVDAILITDDAGRVVNLNPAAERMFGYRTEELLGRPIELLVPIRLRRQFQVMRASQGVGTASEVVRDRPLHGLRRDGSEFVAEVSCSVLPVAEGVLVTSIVRDVTERRDYEARLERQANQDALTGLANRNLASDRLAHAIQSAHRHQTQLAVLFVDLDHFKVINDSLGHRAGDELLTTIAGRLTACLREDDTVARMGGDEFVLLLPHIEHLDRVTAIMRRILDEVRQPLIIEGQSLVVTCSIGASVYPRDGADGVALLKYADAAMYRAKELGRNRFEYFAREMTRRASERLTLESKLRVAIERGELRLHYQPQVDLRSGRIVGAEALVRWFHPELGVISPDRFIPLAEEVGLIAPIGEWVLHEACAQNRAWLDAGLPAMPIAVNLSARQFQETGLVRTVHSALATAGIDGRLLAVELTESQAMQELDGVLRTLEELRHLGVSAALDDFGTGYSSLAYLKRFAIDKLKIDRSFVRNIVNDPDDAAIAATVIAMAHNLRLRVVAEGVETVDQLEFLQRQGCDEVQGFLFSRPLDTDGFARLLAGKAPMNFVIPPRTGPGQLADEMSRHSELALIGSARHV